MQSTITRRAALTGTAAGAAALAIGSPSVAAAELPPEDAWLLKLERAADKARAAEQRHRREAFNPAERAWIAARRKGATAADEARWAAIERRNQELDGRLIALEQAIAEAPAASIIGLAVKARQLIHNADVLNGDYVDDTARSLAEHVIALAAERQEGRS